MYNINDIFKNKLTKILNEYQNKNNILLVFKGFSSEQINILKKLKYNLIYDDIFNSNNLDLSSISDCWFRLISDIINSTISVILYEQLLLIKDDLSKLKNKNIVVYENNILSPWVISNLTQSENNFLYKYVQNEKEKNSQVLDYYSDINFIDANNALLLPKTIEFENVLFIKFWNDIPQININSYSDISDNNNEFMRFGSEDDLKYRYYFCTNHKVGTYKIYCNDLQNFTLNSIISLLYECGISFSLITKKSTPQIEKKDISKYRDILKQFWGISAEFRNLQFYESPDFSRKLIDISQGDIISEIVDQCESAINSTEYSNIFITAPTGAGKSILFQIPAYYLAKNYDAVTIVVSPLIALMNDQVNKLENELNLDYAACINSSMSFDERISTIEKIKRGEKSLIYLAPELLLTMQLESFLNGRKLGLLVIDEAHTVTSWGRDFRSDYWFLSSFISKSKYNGFNYPILCLTATAVYSGDNDVVNETINELGLGKTIIHIGNVKRTNITFDITLKDPIDYNKNMEEVKSELLLNRMRLYINNNEKVLSYCPYRSQVDNIYSNITASERIYIRKYHGKQNSNERKLVEKEYKTGLVKGLICTKAFGMGIDVSDIKHVIHYAPTGTLSDYVQEIGRLARNQNISGIAHVDYFRSDIKYVRILNGISEMKQYQLREMIKKICLLYQKKNKRNLLISADNFEYLFSANEVENKTKNGLLLIAKDLSNKYSFPVIVVRPKPMLSRNYISIPYEIETQINDQYGAFITKINGSNKHQITKNIGSKNGRMETYNNGDTYRANMDEIWEKYFSEYSFGMFKKIFFEREYEYKGERYHISPRICVKIIFSDEFASVMDKVEQVITTFISILSLYKNSKTKQFTANEIEKELFNHTDTKFISHDKFNLFLDIFTEFVEPTAEISFSRNVTRVLRKRKKHGDDESAYFVSSNNYYRMDNWFKQKLSLCAPDENNVFERYYPVSQNHSVEIMPLLKLLEVLDLARYEITGGEKSEVFIRINDPNKLNAISSDNKYTNNILQNIRFSHKSNQELLNAFFTTEMTDEERWDLIEEYFLGNQEYVNKKLSL